MSKRGKYRTDYPRWYGIYGIRFVWHGSWSDPEIIYHKYAINSHIIEDAMVEIFREEGYDDSDEEEFSNWMYKNRDQVRQLCQDAIYERESWGELVSFVG